MPWLIGMFDGAGSVELDETVQQDSARWAFKTVAVASLVNGWRLFPAAHLRTSRQENVMPKGTTVRIGTASVTMPADIDRALLQIWPPRHPTISWPPAVSLDAVGGVQGLTSVTWQ